MKNLTYPKSELLAILQQNRLAHRKLFEEALVGYKHQLEGELADRITKLANGQWRIEKIIRLPEPVDQTKDYDASIRMLELCTEDAIELTESDFRCYVMDEWDWTAQFLATNNSYTGRL